MSSELRDLVTLTFGLCAGIGLGVACLVIGTWLLYFTLTVLISFLIAAFVYAITHRVQP